MPGKARVAFVTFSFGWGGTEKHLEELVTRLDPDHVESVIVCVGPSVYRESLNARYGLDVPVIDAQGTEGFRGYWRLLRSIRPDVVVFVNGKLGLFPWPAYLAARLSGARRVVAIEHLQGEAPLPVPTGGGPLGVVRRWLGWRARYMFKIALCGHIAHRTICVSRAVRDTVVNTHGYPASKTLVIVNGIDIPYYTRRGLPPAGVRERLGIDPSAHVLVCLARLGRLKRIDILLEAVALLRARRPKSACVIVGGGPLDEEVRAMAVALRVDDVVHFVGHSGDVRPYLETADVYVSTSEREGFGLAVAEAMAMGLACVVTDIGGHDEMVVHEVTGLLVPVGSASAVVEAVERLLDREDLRRTVSEAGRKRVEALFSLDLMVQRIQTVLLS